MERRLGFAVKVMAREDLPSHDTRRWQSGPTVRISIENMHRILTHLDTVGIRMYRMSSDFVPYATHPDMPQFHRQIDENLADLDRLGNRARELDIRLSFHPSQYVVLNAQDPEIVRKSVEDLHSQARLLDAMGQPAEAVVVLHVGGVYGDKPAARERFASTYETLPEPARRRLVIENDETSFTVEDCQWIHRRTGVPMVFDHQHHRLNPGSLTAVDAARVALNSWPDEVVPKIHFSSPRLDGREVKRGGSTRIERPLLRQHADYIDPWTFSDFLDELRDVHFDVMLEAKAKDLAVLKLREDLAAIGCGHVLQSGSPSSA